VILVAVLIGLLIGVQLYGIFTNPATDQFVVLVAPFQEPDGTVGQTGREIASALTTELQQASGGHVVARAIDAPPADETAALAIVGREDADALIWGQVAPGSLLDRPSLVPMLAYRPNGVLAPLSWEGYAGRFEMPEIYTLSSAPINGRAILPGLLGALADYQAGRFDATFNTLGALLDDYPALVPALPRTLRGNILWARGAYQEAAGEYRRAIGAGLAGPQEARLYNNLGAILGDAGDPAAQDSFNQAVAELKGNDLSALRYNLGLQELRAGHLADAATQLEIARSPGLARQMTPAAPLLLTLGETYRMGGAYQQAQAVLDEAARQINDAADTTTPELRTLMAGRLAAELEEQRALLSLAQATGARGPLLWELEIANPIPANLLTGIESQLNQSVEDTRVLAQRWTRLSTLKDASDEPIGGQIAISHALHAQALLRERQRWQAAIEIERGEVTGQRRPRGLMSIWAMIAGDRTPVGQGRTILNNLLASQPADVDALVLLGRSYLLGDNLEEAGKQFDRAAAVDPTRPEPVYGQAQVALPKDRTRARQLLARAIALNGAYFPAREQLAELSESDDVRDWPTAIEQRRWLAQNRPSDAQTLALAEALRRSGPSGYAEAEQLLLPMAKRNQIGALLALSRLYQDLNNSQAAGQALEQAQQTAPRDPEVAYQYGQFLEHQGDAAGAEAQYQRALTSAPNHVRSRLALGRLYAERGDSAAAGQQYSAALSAGANDPNELKRIGVVLLANGEYASAATAYERGIAVSKDDPELHHGLAQAYLQQKKLDAAQTEEQRALALRDGAYPEALVGLGDIALQRGNRDEAVSQYNAALQLNSRLTTAYLGLGRTSAAAGNWSVAQAHFRNAVRNEPASAEAHLWLGEALVRQPDPNAAIGEYARALELKPNYPAAYFGLAQAQMLIGQSDLARENLRAALILSPNYAEALLLQGKLNEQQGDDNAAIQSYTDAIKASNILAEPYYRRALLYIRHDRFDDAVNDLESATKIQANFPEAHYWLGRAYLGRGDPKSARAEFVKAIEQRGGNYAEARFYQGLAEEQLGQRDAAVTSYQAALTQDNNGVWADEARTALNRLRQP
jgi:tetratricopeptide (TPR) repeat protein